MKLGTEVSLAPTTLCYMTAPKKGHIPQFSAHVRCGQTAGWMKMPLGTELGLGPGDIMLDGDPAPLKKGHRPPISGPCLLWPNGWVDQDATIGMVLSLGPGHIVLDGDPSPERGTAPNFRPMSCGQTKIGGLYCFQGLSRSWKNDFFSRIFKALWRPCGQGRGLPPCQVSS